MLPGQILLDDEELDPAFPMVLMLHKPVGYVVTAPDDERILDPKVYDLLPYRWAYWLQQGCGGVSAETEAVEVQTTHFTLTSDEETLIYIRYSKALRCLC